ncbi:hypothetical protein GCM10010129_48650 [Streptomyces fumigatiscleroticus]|nr:hypothetical protein GCM10010129_48650 [Streptomyces fumigatiscleroticus]
MLRLSVAITVTYMTVVTRTTPVVRPQSRLGIRLRSYGPLGILLGSNGASPDVHMRAVVHRRTRLY